MYSVGDWVLSGIGMSILPFAVCLFLKNGLEIGFVVGRTFFLSVSMCLFFKAWLQFINFDGSWPADQPFVDVYTPSAAETARVDSALVHEMSKQDWDDYHRCLKHNVCVRRFARASQTMGAAAPAPAPQAPFTSLDMPPRRDPTRPYARACMIANGVTTCSDDPR
jgi:hypothetical protein